MIKIFLILIKSGNIKTTERHNKTNNMNGNGKNRSREKAKDICYCACVYFNILLVIYTGCPRPPLLK